MINFNWMTHVGRKPTISNFCLHAFTQENLVDDRTIAIDHC